MAEEGKGKKWSLALKIGVAVMILALLILIAYIAYRIWWEFDNTAVQSYINQESAKYQNPASAAVLINDSVKNILESRTLTKQVKDFAANNNMTKEQALVTAAIAEAKNFGYLTT
jgi:hypothetical protein